MDERGRRVTRAPRLVAVGIPGAFVVLVAAVALAGTPVLAAPAVGDPAAGKQVFLQSGCSGCHTLKAAGTAGTVGPNLDATKPSYDRVVQLVTNGRGGMPPFKGSLTAKQISDVAAFVAQVAGGGQAPAGTAPTQPSTRAGPKRGPVQVTLREWRLTASRKSVAAGPVTLVVRNTGKVSHRLAVLRSNRDVSQLAVRGGRVSERGLVVAITIRPGQVVRLTLRLGRGRYVLLCNEKGHYKRGLAVALRVGVAAAVSTPPAAGPTPPPVPTSGRELFRTFCGGCHTLAEAQTAGTKGPNLDRERPDCEDALEAMRGGEDDMPSLARALTSEQMMKIAVYVAQATGGDADDCD